MSSLPRTIMNGIQRSIHGNFNGVVNELVCSIKFRTRISVNRSHKWNRSTISDINIGKNTSKIGERTERVESWGIGQGSNTSTGHLEQILFLKFFEYGPFDFHKLIRH